MKKVPNSLYQLEQFISRRLVVRPNIEHLSAGDQRELVS